MRSLGTDKFDVAIAGAGPAGSSAAIRLAGAGLSVVLIEQKQFPRDKLCGEFISPECLTHFAEMGIDLGATGGVPIEETIFYTQGGRSVKVPSGWLGRAGASALGLSRSTMDTLLLERARGLGVDVREGTRVKNRLYARTNVIGVRTANNDGDLEVLAPIVIDARGRSRGFAGRSTDTRAAKYVAFKTHLTGVNTAARTCEMFVYSGGYGGCLPVENGLHNLCFIAPASVVGALGSDPERFLREVVMTNRRAAEVLADARPVTRWLAVPISRYGRRDPAAAPGMLAIGDAAAFIDPFTGSGILLALESAKLAADVILTDRNANVGAIQTAYQARYAREFSSRLRASSLLRHAASTPTLAGIALSLLGISQGFLRRAAQATRSRKAAET